MPESQPLSIYGIHSLTAYNLDTREPLGRARVLGSAEINLEGSLNPLNGGSSKYPWKVERGLITGEISMTLREYPPFLFETLLGKAMTLNSAETNGNVSTLTNAKGSSVVAATGVITATAKSGSEGDLKFSGFIVKAASATTVDVYAYTDVDFAQGADKAFENDLLKVTSSPLTITTDTAVEIPGFGVELTGGSGTIAMTVGDTATFEVRPKNIESQEVVVGSSTEVFTDFGLVISAQRPGDNYMTNLDIYRVAGIGLPINFGENEFSEASVTMQMYRDSTRNGVFKLERVKATG